MKNTLTFPIPGRGLALSWAPAESAVAGGNAIAVGGHLIGRQTYKAGGERYDTKIFNTDTGAYIKRFGAHYWWSVSNVWEMNPYLGELLAQGAGDHAAKLFNAAGRGTPSNNGSQDAGMRGRYSVDDGALPGIKTAYGNNTPGLPNINGWVTALAISPDGRYLASANRDRMVRIWQLADDVHPDEQFRVIKVYNAHKAGNLTSIRWAPDGRSFAVGHKEGSKGEAAIFAWDPVNNRWPSNVVREFSGGVTTTTNNKGKTTVKVTKGVAFGSQPKWISSRPQLHAEEPVWRTSGLGNVWNVRYSPDGRYLAVTSSKASAVYDLQTGKSYALHTKAHGLDFSPDGRWVAVGGADKRVYIYDRESSPPFKRHDTLAAHKEPVVGAVAWSRDGDTLATTAGGPLLGNAEFNNSVQGKDDTIRLWKWSAGNGVKC